jgi:hypothetical protein
MDTAQLRCVPGVRFRSGRAFRFLPMPAVASNFGRRSISLSANWRNARAFRRLSGGLVIVRNSLRGSYGALGLTPKVFARVRRFQSALGTIAMNDDPGWTGIALGCGYFDQAHFNHDFRAFSGISPSLYVVKKTPHLNHVPV